MDLFSMVGGVIFMAVFLVIGYVRGYHEGSKKEITRSTNMLMWLVGEMSEGEKKTFLQAMERARGKIEERSKKIEKELNGLR